MAEIIGVKHIKYRLRVLTNGVAVEKINYLYGILAIFFIKENNFK